MITVVILDAAGTELDRFQMIHAAFENRAKFPESPDLFTSFVDIDQLESLDNSPYSRMIRAAYFQGRAGGGIGNQVDLEIMGLPAIARDSHGFEILEPSAPYPAPTELTPGICICTQDRNPNFYCPVHGR